MTERLRIATPHVIHQTIDGEVILVHLARGTYYSLRGSGALLFGALVTGASPSELAEILVAQTDADDAKIAAAVASFVDELVREALVVSAVTPAPEPPTAAASKASFEPPHLEVFTDLQDLLAADPIHEVEDSGWPTLTRK